MNDTTRNPADVREPLELYEGGARPIVASLLFGLCLVGTAWFATKSVTAVRVFFAVSGAFFWLITALTLARRRKPVLILSGEGVRLAGMDGFMLPWTGIKGFDFDNWGNSLTVWFILSADIPVSAFGRNRWVKYLEKPHQIRVGVEAFAGYEYNDIKKLFASYHDGLARELAELEHLMEKYRWLCDKVLSPRRSWRERLFSRFRTRR